jgi:hypothetical protein
MMSFRQLITPASQRQRCAQLCRDARRAEHQMSLKRSDAMPYAFSSKRFRQLAAFGQLKRLSPPRCLRQRQLLTIFIALLARWPLRCR